MNPLDNTLYGPGFRNSINIYIPPFIAFGLKMDDIIGQKLWDTILENVEFEIDNDVWGNIRFRDRILDRVNEQHNTKIR